MNFIHFPLINFVLLILVVAYIVRQFLIEANSAVKNVTESAKTTYMPSLVNHEPAGVLNSENVVIQIKDKMFSAKEVRVSLSQIGEDDKFGLRQAIVVLTIDVEDSDSIELSAMLNGSDCA